MVNKPEVSIVINKDNQTPPRDTFVYCGECDWEGVLSDCETEMDSEDGESPQYEVLVCPKCGEFSVNL